MPGARDIVIRLREVAIWLLAATVIVGPAGLGGSTALAAASKACGTACPCDVELHDDHGDASEEAGSGACRDAQTDGAGGDDPCQDQCPEDCPDCGCCVAVAMVMGSLPMLEGSGSCEAPQALSPATTPASDTADGVFRPPRSLI